MKLIIARIGTNQTVRFAAEELERCLRRMDSTLWIENRLYDAYDSTVRGVLWVGRTDDEAESLDDEIIVNMTDGIGIVTGSNDRSVLLAV